MIAWHQALKYLWNKKHLYLCPHNITFLTLLFLKKDIFKNIIRIPVPVEFSQNKATKIVFYLPSRTYKDTFMYM